MPRRLGIFAIIILVVGMAAVGIVIVAYTFVGTAQVQAAASACGKPGTARAGLPDGYLVEADDLDDDQRHNVGHIISIGMQRNLPPAAWQIAIQAGMTESGLRNLNHGDRDSLGMFQMRPSMGWGTPEQVKDPIYAVNKFYDVMVKVPDWQSKRTGDVAQAVERSGFPDRYHKWEALAHELVTKASQDMPSHPVVQVAITCTLPTEASPILAGNPVASRNARELSDWLYASGGLTYTTSHGCDPEPDLKSGQMAANGLAFLKEMAEAGFKLRMSCTMTGHDKDGKLHPIWHAYDIDMVNGQAVGPGRSESLKMIDWLAARPNGKLPYEVGGPLTPGARGKHAGPGGTRGGPYFTDSGHQGHFHMGFKDTATTPNGGWY
jgi:hypothetical protein